MLIFKGKTTPFLFRNGSETGRYKGLMEHKMPLFMRCCVLKRLVLIALMLAVGFLQTKPVLAQEEKTPQTQSETPPPSLPLADQAGTAPPPKSPCLASHDVRALVERGEVLPVHKVMQIARHHFSGEIVKARLCPEQDRLIYLLTLLDKTGQIRLLAMDARNGQMLVRP